MAYEKMERNISAELNNLLLEEGYKWRVQGELSAISVSFYGESYDYKYFYFDNEAEAEEFCKEQNKKYPQLGYKLSVQEVERRYTAEDWANWEKEQEKQKEAKKQKRLENEAKRAAAQGLTVEECRSKKAEERKAKARAKRVQKIKEEIAKLTKELEELKKK